jgi:D-xylose 1-dehydrogenase (NADP+, D-xylono-1,5-lactone-forming)
MNLSSDHPLRIGVLGAAKIARLFAEGVRASRKVVVAAVASRDVDRAMVFARDTGVAVVHSTYQALLDDPEIDAIYVPLPNNLHAAWSIRAADAGKHVLCEKPLAATATEARAVFEAARKNGVYVVEAYPYRAQPQTLKMRELLASNVIGSLQLIQASFGFPLADAANIRMNPSLAGGALMDAGSYPVSLVRTVAGTKPIRVFAISRWAESGVDLTTLATLEFPSGLLAQVSCSFATARHRHAFIAGDAGSINTTYFNDTSAAFPPVLEVKRGTGWDAQYEVIKTATSNGFLAEAESFHDLVRHGWDQWVGATPDESIDIALTLDALAISARTGAPSDLHARS